MSGPLAGLRVLDITSVIMGPYATAQLGDMGADVIKVEPPTGDIARQLGPARSAGMSAITLNLGRNKRSAVLDRGEREDRDRFAELLATCDVIITNLRPRSRRRLGLDWNEVHQANPAVVLCTAQAFASESEKGEEPAYDDVIEAVSGMSDLYRRAFGTPQFSPSVLADKICGLVIVNSVLAALHSRATTGEGQWVDVPMTDTMLAFNLVEHLGGKSFDPPVGDIGWSRTLVANRGPHHAADGWICVMPYTDKNWTDFFRTVQRPDLATDPRFSSSAARHENNATLQTELANLIAQRTVGEWLEDCRRLEIAAEPVLDLDEIEQNPYYAARHALIDARHPTEGDYKLIRFPVDFSATPVTDYRPAPHIGPHLATVSWLEDHLPQQASSEDRVPVRGGRLSTQDQEHALSAQPRMRTP
jgi:crotonobetainyl-CoA:carnitine CoA-transferase CaiB-like acyl-CoA transferase